MFSYSLTYTKIKIICWFIIVVFLIWAIFFSSFNLISNVALLSLVFLSWRSLGNDKIYLSLILITFVLFLSAYSLILENQPTKILRFGLILFFVGYAYFIKLPLKPLLNVLKYVSIPYCVFLVIAEMYLLFFLDPNFMPYLRNEIILSHGLGDVYPKYGNFYAIQLRGTAILPFIFMLSFITDLFKSKIKLYRFILILGIIISGNFSYLLGLVVFFCIIFFNKSYTLQSWSHNFIKLAVLIIFIGPFLLNFVDKQIEEKKEVSNATRIDQAEVLIRDLSSSPLTLLFGKGLGNNIEVKTKYRDYSNADYYELQTLYFFNQLGIIPFILFIIYNVYCTIKYVKSRKGYILYISYLIYACANPYLLDTTQVVVIITLVNLIYNKRNYSENINPFLINQTYNT